MVAVKGVAAVIFPVGDGHNEPASPLCRDKSDFGCSASMFKDHFPAEISLCRIELWFFLAHKHFSSAT